VRQIHFCYLDSDHGVVPAVCCRDPMKSGFPNARCRGHLEMFFFFKDDIIVQFLKLMPKAAIGRCIEVDSV